MSIEENVRLVTTIVSGAATSAVAATWDSARRASKIVRMIVSVPAFTGTPSATVSIIDGFTSTVVYQSPVLPKTTKTSIPVDVDIFPNDIVEVEVTGDIGAGANQVTTVLHMER